MDFKKFTDIIENFSYFTCLNLLIILALFFLKIYFREILTLVLESGINANSKNVKHILSYIVIGCTLYGTFLFVKSGQSSIFSLRQ